jgi:hypothetical protein
MTITSDQLRSHARFGTPLSADAPARLAEQQDALLDALAAVESALPGAFQIVADQLRAHGRTA